jgi:hypothetical protein
LVLTDWTTDWLLNWVRPPAALARSIWMSWLSMPRPSAQRGGVRPAEPVGDAGSDAPMLIEVGLVVRRTGCRRVLQLAVGGEGDLARADQAVGVVVQVARLGAQFGVPFVGARALDQRQGDGALAALGVRDRDLDLEVRLDALGRVQGVVRHRVGGRVVGAGGDGVGLGGQAQGGEVTVWPTVTSGW